MDPRSKSIEVQPPLKATMQVEVVNALFDAIKEMDSGELQRLRAIIPTLSQQVSTRAIYTTSSHLVVTSTESVTMKDVLARLGVKISLAARVSSITSQLPKEPIPRGVMPISIATLFRRIPTETILTELEAHGMVLANPLHLAAFMNMGTHLVCTEPLIAFGRVTIKRRTWMIPYSIRKDKKENLLFEIHRPDFWMKQPKLPDQTFILQLLLVPKTT